MSPALQCLPATCCRRALARSQNLYEAFNLLNFSPKCNNTFMHYLNGEIEFKIWSAQQSSSKSLYCFSFAFPYSHLIVKYTFHHKSYREPIRVTCTGRVGWTAALKPLPAILEIYALNFTVRSQKQAPKVQGSENTRARHSCIGSSVYYTATVSKAKQCGRLKIWFIPYYGLKSEVLWHSFPYSLHKIY